MEKAKLFEDLIPREDIEIPGRGTITVRGLSRIELLLAGKLSDEGAAAMERRMLAFAMVDPEMTEEDVKRWQNASRAGEIQPVIAKVNELSGIGKDAQKEAYKSLREEPGA